MEILDMSIMRTPERGIAGVDPPSEASVPMNPKKSMNPRIPAIRRPANTANVIFKKSFILIPNFHKGRYFWDSNDNIFFFFVNN